MGCGGSKPEEAGAASGAAPQSEAVDAGAAPRKMSGTKRRVAVRAEVVEDEHFDPVSYTHSDEEKAFINTALAMNDIFGGLKKEDLEFLATSFLPEAYEYGDCVINQGEQGDKFYIVKSGQFAAKILLPGTKEPKQVATYGAEQSFGELALLYNAPRAATVVCLGKDGKNEVWGIERKRFRHVMVNANMANMTNKAEGFLKAVPSLAGLSDHQRVVLGDHMEELFFNGDEYIVSMGDIADAMFFIKSGEVACHQGDKQAGDILRMKTGDVFGESCLEPTAADAVRKAHVVAVGPVVVLRLKAQDFKDHLGNMKDILAQNFKRKVIEGVSIEKTHIFALLSPEDQEEFLDKLVEKTFEDGEVVIKEGMENDSFYVIKSGVAQVWQEEKTQDGKVIPGRELVKLEHGKFFGERALLKGEKASATIKALSEGEGDKKVQLSCYTCDRDTFTAVLGPLQALIDKEVARREEQMNKPDRPKYVDLEIRRILGVGTFGRVKLVVHKPTGTTYALKCMRKAQVVATKQQSHVLNEKKILAMMDHPFILALVQTYQDAGELYMLIELSLGGELFTLLAKRAPLFDQPARFYAASVVSMFSYMHGLKVIYRDLKPENLLLDKDGYLKLVDFGFAKILQDRTWTLCGTPEYLAPEIILNKGHGFGADWWCVGILAFECLTGTTPFVSNDPMEGYRKIIKCRVPWPAQLSSMARDFIDRLLCVDPSRRLGCLKGGSKDVRSHPWFQTIDFKVLESKLAPAPYVPKIKSATDDSNFDTYTDDGKMNYPQEDFAKDMFAEFADEWVGPDPK